MGDIPANMDKDGRNAKHLSFVFNVFVWLQIWNEIDARKVNGEMNVLEFFFDNIYFPAILVLTCGLQVFIVEAGGEFTKTRPLTAAEWGWSIFIGSFSLVYHQAIRLIPVENNETIALQGDEFKQEKEFLLL